MGNGIHKGFGGNAQGMDVGGGGQRNLAADRGVQGVKPLLPQWACGSAAHRADEPLYAETCILFDTAASERSHENCQK